MISVGLGPAVFISRKEPQSALIANQRKYITQGGSGPKSHVWFHSRPCRPLFVSFF